MKSKARENLLWQDFWQIVENLLNLENTLSEINALIDTLQIHYIILNENLWLIDDEAELNAVVDPFFEQSEKQVNQYREGDQTKKDKLWGFFFGQCMRRLNDRADKDALTALLKKKLAV